MEEDDATRYLSTKRGFARWDVRFSLLCVAATVAAVWYYIDSGGGPAWPRTIVVGTWLGWALLPPAYFLTKWTFYPGPATGENFERLKHRQHLASQFWVAGVTVLSVILFQAGALEGLAKSSRSQEKIAKVEDRSPGT